MDDWRAMSGGQEDEDLGKDYLGVGYLFIIVSEFRARISPIWFFSFPAFNTHVGQNTPVGTSGIGSPHEMSRNT